jgi:hypothetical protein
MSVHYRASPEPLEEAKMHLNRDMDGGPFMVYFLPILGRQKATVLGSVKGWCAAGNLEASKVSIRMDDRIDGQTDDRDG